MTPHAVERCPKDRYALVNGVCPMCGGRDVAERLPIPAPLPKAKGPPPTRRRFVFRRRRRT